MGLLADRRRGSRRRRGRDPDLRHPPPGRRRSGAPGRGHPHRRRRPIRPGGRPAVRSASRGRGSSSDPSCCGAGRAPRRTGRCWPVSRCRPAGSRPCRWGWQPSTRPVVAGSGHTSGAASPSCSGSCCLVVVTVTLVPAGLAAPVGVAGGGRAGTRVRRVGGRGRRAPRGRALPAAGAADDRRPRGHRRHGLRPGPAGGGAGASAAPPGAAGLPAGAARCCSGRSASGCCWSTFPPGWWGSPSFRPPPCGGRGRDRPPRRRDRPPPLSARRRRAERPPRAAPGDSRRHRGRRVPRRRRCGRPGVRPLLRVDARRGRDRPPGAAARGRFPAAAAPPAQPRPRAPAPGGRGAATARPGRRPRGGRSARPSPSWPTGSGSRTPPSRPRRPDRAVEPRSAPRSGRPSRSTCSPVAAGSAGCSSGPTRTAIRSAPPTGSCSRTWAPRSAPWCRPS